jgi:hypothetical protein
MNRPSTPYQLPSENQQIAQAGRLIELILGMDRPHQRLDARWLLEQLLYAGTDAADSKARPTLAAHHHDLTIHVGCDEIRVAGTQAVRGNFDHGNHIWNTEGLGEPPAQAALHPGFSYRK